MLNKFKVSYLTILRGQLFIDHRDLSFHEQLLKILRTFFADKNSDIKAVGTTIMSKAPNIKEPISIDDGLFIPQKHFEASFFSDQMNMFIKDNKKYVLEFIPFLYSGTDIASGVLNTKALVEVNALSRESHFYTISYGLLREVPVFIEHIYEVIDVINDLVDFHIASADMSSKFILPFYTIEHFLHNYLPFEEIIMVYELWLTRYRAFKAILEATQTTHKIVLGLADTICEMSVISLSEKQKDAKQLYDIYKSTRTEIRAELKANCDLVTIETFSSFGHGDIVTLVSWLKRGNKQGTEIYYHLSDNSPFLEELEKECNPKERTVNRSVLEFFDHIDRLHFLNKKPGLH